MKQNLQHSDIVELHEDLSSSPLYSEDLAPVPKGKRTWSKWNLAAIWVGMAVCIPTYMLAADMIKSGVSWWIALLIIGLANLIITLPMILNGHAGVKYGIPFPVLGRAAFGTKGIHIASIVRAIVACGWFGIQTWIGGLAIYAIYCVLVGQAIPLELTAGKFISFAIFWLINIFFVWRGTESIRWLEEFSAPILIFIGLLLIGWGTYQAGSFSTVLEQSKQLERPSAVLSQNENQDFSLKIEPLTDKNGQRKATEFHLIVPTQTNDELDLGWQPLPQKGLPIALNFPQLDKKALENRTRAVDLEVRKAVGDDFITSSQIKVKLSEANADSWKNRLWQYILLLTAMVGFWATMSLSIADITRYAATQKDQVAGQLIGLPTTMVLYSFVGIFVTCAAIINFDDILLGDDAPWDPVSLLAKFESPFVVVIAQIFMLIATLSTNIAANVIAPANAFSNLMPQKISFRMGGMITGIIGILICPWALINYIIPILLFISGLLGPVLGILLSDYYLVRKLDLQLAELYKTDGEYAFGGSGFNPAALMALALGVGVALIGYFVPSLGFLYNLSWFTGFFVSFVAYYFFMKR